MVGKSFCDKKLSRDTDKYERKKLSRDTDKYERNKMEDELFEV